MGESSNISWCTHSWNTAVGCHPTSTGCKNCYARTIVEDRMGKDFLVVTKTAPATFRAPLKWAKKTPGARVFANSLSDFFLEEQDPWRAEAWDIIRQTPELIYLILTKRPERIARCLPVAPSHPNSMTQSFDSTWPWPNVWLGVSVETQQFAKRMDVLRKVPVYANQRFISAEPLLGPLDLSPHLYYNPSDGRAEESRGGTLCGCPGGNNRDRPTRPDMATSVSPLAQGATTNNHDPLHETTSGTLQWARGEVFPSSRDGERTSYLCSRTQVSLSSFHGTNSARSNNQSQERRPEGQQARESGAGNILRTDDSCKQGSGDRWWGQSMGRDQSPSQTDQGERGTHQEASGSRGETCSDCGGLRYFDATGQQDRPRRALAFSFVITGGESGPGHRPMDLQWCRSIRDQCKAAGVLYHHKQGSHLRPGMDALLDGVEHRAVPGGAA